MRTGDADISPVERLSQICDRLEKIDRILERLAERREMLCAEYDELEKEKNGLLERVSLNIKL